MQAKPVLRVLLIEGVFNTLVMIAKFFVGAMTGSAAILGDALHSLSDIANNIIAYFSVKLASQPPDHDHQYGHHKFEQLAVFILATLLVVVAFEIIISSIDRFNQPVTQSISGLVLMIIVLCLNIMITVWEHAQSKKLDSSILRADANHTLSDVLTTVTVIVGWQLSIMGYAWIDSVIAVVIALMVMYLAYDLFKRSIPILVDQVGADTDKMIEAVNRIDGVEKIRRLRSRIVGNSITADIIIVVDGELTTAESHRLADLVEEVLGDQFSVNDVTVHIEPI